MVAQKDNAARRLQDADAALFKAPDDYVRACTKAE
jgi:hypothetical protein